MRYYATAHPGTASVGRAMSDGLLGCIVTPRKSTHATADLIADNGCFGAGYMGDDYWWAWLAEQDRARMRFATAPDVVGDWERSRERSLPWLSRIRALGVPAALVAQDGLTLDSVPWGEFDTLFLGGSTEWKLGDAAEAVARAATERGVPVHMGRVNTMKRMRHAYLIGCASVDGTYLAYGPEKNLPRLLSFMREATYPALDGATWH